MTASAYSHSAPYWLPRCFTRLADREAFDIAGKSGLYFHWGQKKSQIAAPVTNTIASEDDDEQPVFSEEAVSEHLRFRYGAAGSVRCVYCW